MSSAAWTTLDDVLDILDFVAAYDLIENVDPVQYTIRLLLPEGSLLLEHPDLQPHLGLYAAEHLTYTWTSADPAADRLQHRLAALVEESVTAGEPIAATYLRVRAATLEAATGREIPAGVAGPIRAGSTEGRPRLTEPWFC